MVVDIVFLFWNYEFETSFDLTKSIITIDISVNLMLAYFGQNNWTLYIKKSIILFPFNSKINAHYFLFSLQI